MNPYHTPDELTAPLDEPRRIDHVIIKLILAGWFIPVAAIFVCASYYLRARLELGYWPTYGNPDPKDLEWPFHHISVILMILAIYPALVWTGIFSLILSFKKRLEGVVALIMTAILFALLHLAAKLPPADEFMAWYLD